MVLFTAPYGKGLLQKLSKGTYYVELAQAFAYQENDYEYDYEESAKKELQYEIFCNNITQRSPMTGKMCQEKFPVNGKKLILGWWTTRRLKCLVMVNGRKLTTSTGMSMMKKTNIRSGR